MPIHVGEQGGTTGGTTYQGESPHTLGMQFVPSCMAGGRGRSAGLRSGSEAGVHKPPPPLPGPEPDERPEGLRRGNRPPASEPAHLPPIRTGFRIKRALLCAAGPARITPPHTHTHPLQRHPFSATRDEARTTTATAPPQSLLPGCTHHQYTKCRPRRCSGRAASAPPPGAGPASAPRPCTRRRKRRSPWTSSSCPPRCGRRVSD